MCRKLRFVPLNRNLGVKFVPVALPIQVFDGKQEKKGPFPHVFPVRCWEGWCFRTAVEEPLCDPWMDVESFLD